MPMKDRPAADMIRPATLIVAFTTMGPMALGSTWVKIMAISLLPDARAASM